jgi:hypothetical protein
MDRAGRILGLAGDPDPALVREKVGAFRSLILLHAAVQSWHWFHWATGSPSAERAAVQVVGAASLYLSGCFALSFWRRGARFAALLALPILLYQMVWHFPHTANHFYLSLWGVAMLACFGSLSADSDEDNALQLQILQWSVLIVLFYSGFQKLVYGSYFQADFLAYQIGTKEIFADLFRHVLPADELTRLRAIDPTQDGAGPYRTTSLALLSISNAVYLAEIALPLALLYRRSRTMAAWLAIAFVGFLQAGAREILFGLLMLSMLLLFLQEGAFNRRLLWSMIALYLYALMASFGVVPGSSLLNPSSLPGRVHL